MMFRNRLALVTTASCFLLILAGGLVHATGSGLACPDWPLCGGTAFPEMHGGVLIEHGHRLIALTVALLTFGLMAALWRKRPEPSLRWLGIGAAIAVLAQASLGALTVLLRLPMAVTTVHLAVSVAFFCLLLTITIRTSEAPPIAISPG